MDKGQLLRQEGGPESNVRAALRIMLLQHLIISRTLSFFLLSTLLTQCLFCRIAYRWNGSILSHKVLCQLSIERSNYSRRSVETSHSLVLPVCLSGPIIWCFQFRMWDFPPFFTLLPPTPRGQTNPRPAWSYFSLFSLGYFPIATAMAATRIARKKSEPADVKL